MLPNAKIVMQPHPITDSDSFESILVGAIKAGFPSPAENVREKLDLVKLLVRHTASTFFFQVGTENPFARGEEIVAVGEGEHRSG